MINRSESLRPRYMATLIAISAIGLTTTFNTSGITYPSLDNSYLIYPSNDMGTTTPSPKSFEMEGKTNYDLAKELFGEGVRDFTEEEAGAYEKFLGQIYKPTGVNIFDLC